jgi:hypothetical protein
MRTIPHRARARRGGHAGHRLPPVLDRWLLARVAHIVRLYRARDLRGPLEADRFARELVARCRRVSLRSVPYICTTTKGGSSMITGRPIRVALDAQALCTVPT